MVRIRNQKLWVFENYWKNVTKNIFENIWFDEKIKEIQDIIDVK